MPTILDNIPRPVLWGLGGLLVLAVFLRGRRAQDDPQDSRLGMTMSSMSLASSSNIQALDITSQRDVALAAEYTQRHALASRLMLDREGQALDYLSRRSEGRQMFTLRQQETASTNLEGRRNFLLNRFDQKQKMREADQAFRFATVEAKRAFIMDKKYFPKIFELELADMNLQREQARFDYDIQTRRLDIMQFQGAYPQGVPGAVSQYADAAGNIIGSGVGAYNAITGGPAQQAPTAGGGGAALGGAATGAAVGLATCAATGWFTFGASCIPAAAAGAAAGGGGGMS